MRVIWLDISSSFSHASLALPVIHAASVQPVAADWRAVAATINDDVGTVAARVLLQEPDVLAASVYLFTRESVLRVARRVKAVLPACRVLLGGPEFLGDNSAFLRREPAVTAVVRGEGEAAFGQWLQRLDEPGEWGAIPGLCWRDAGGAYRDNGLAVVDRWPEMPSPSASGFFAWSKPFVQLETSRGCPHRCRFCTSCRFGPPRDRAPEYIRSELETFRRHGVREVRVLDRTFNAEPGRAVNLLHLFLDEFPEMRFHLEVHPAFLNADLRAVLGTAPPGRLHLEVGLQTTCPAAYEACRRGGTPDASLAGLEFLCACRQLAVHVDLLAGLPGLTLDHLLADVRRVVLLEPNEIQLETLKILPGTPFQREAGDFGLVFATDPPYEVLRSPQMSTADLSTARDLSRVVDQYANHPALRAVVRGAVARRPAFFPEFLQFLRQEGDGRPLPCPADGGVLRGGASVMALTSVPASLENRFRRLYAFLAVRDAATTSELEVAWVKAGLSPARGLGHTQPWKAEIPADAEQIEGQVVLPRPGTHVWLLRCPGMLYWFVFDRSSARSRPVAILRKPVAD